MEDIHRLITKYREGPRQLAELVGSLTDEQADARPFADKWTIREVVCHLTDFEIVGAERIRRVLAEDNPSLPDGDPDAFAAALHYENRCLAGELAAIESIRNCTAAMLSACAVEDFQRTGVHSAEGPMTLESLLERVNRHLPHHVQFIEEKLSALENGDG